MSASVPELSHAEIQELLGAYALDAVDKETAALVEQHLAECVRCSVEVAQHHEVAGLLANSGGASPASLWDGIASQLDGSVPPAWEGLAGKLETGGDRVIDPVGESLPADAGVVPITTRTRRGQWARRAAAVVGAAAAVLALVLGLQVHHLDNQVTALQSQPSLSSAEQAALRAPSTMVVALRGSGAGPSPARAVTVVLTKSGTGFVEAGGLSALPKDRTYQLWGIIGGQTISLGLLGPSPGVIPFSVAGDVAVNAFAITAEHGGGVVHSTNQPVVAGEVTA
jgi:anti-sigma factor RsiW